MRERPILFNGTMIRALLDGKKTVTRRVVKPQYLDGPWSVKPTESPRHERHSHDWWLPTGSQPYAALPPCPFGQPGDRLWVRETFAIYGDRKQHVIHYRANHPQHVGQKGMGYKPSIHMPRWASRILLEITDVRVERLQAITPDQAVAEGIDGEISRQHLETSPVRHQCREAEILGFAGLWNAMGGNWDDNPWVWVVEFRRVTA
ncbi:hypothetical protein [Pseudomonas guariconensis]|uniref:hypothetical protein n=1 Tax=Pseudomonas guariconensis TaxID=1288410 RepID=UPI00384CC475